MPPLQQVFKNLEQFILWCVRCNGISRTQFEPINSPTLPIIEVEAWSVSNIHLVREEAAIRTAECSREGGARRRPD